MRIKMWSDYRSNALLRFFTDLTRRHDPALMNCLFFPSKWIQKSAPERLLNLKADRTRGTRSRIDLAGNSVNLHHNSIIDSFTQFAGRPHYEIFALLSLPPMMMEHIFKS